MNVMTKGTSKSSANVARGPQTTTVHKSMVASKGTGAPSPSHLIDARIAELRDWRGATLARVRALIKQADPEVVEEWK